MSAPILGDAALARFKERFSGKAIFPGEEGYDGSRAIFNAMVDRHPAVIAVCSSVDDVAAAVELARASGAPLAVKGGGHGVRGDAVCDGGVVIDLDGMRSVEVDPEARIARVGGGARWGDVDPVTQEHGLATTGGRVSTTGVAGLTLGGGSGWLERKHGLACDNLVACELVTADGRVVRASADENPELFWALHGGGGNFGVVTSIELRLHPVGPQVVAGLLLHPFERGRELLAFYREFIREAAPEHGHAVGFLTGPPEEFVPAHLQGRLVAAVAVFHGGPVDEALEAVRPLKEFGPPEVDLVEPMPYAGFQSMLDDPPGFRNYWTAEYLDELPDEALDAVYDLAGRMPLGHNQLFLIGWGGAIARPTADTPMSKRDTPWVVHPLALWEEADRDEEHIAWVKAHRTELAPWASGGVYLNFIGDEGADRVRAAYGEHYDRIVAVKAEWDPENLFRLNQNIEPKPRQEPAERR